MLLTAAGASNPRGSIAIGLVAVVIAAAVLFLLIRRQRRKRAQRWFELSTDDAESAPELSPPEAMNRALAQMNEHSPLRRVIGIGRSISIGEVELESICVELRETTNRVTVVITDPVIKRQMAVIEESMRKHRRPDHDDWMGPLQPQVIVSDDVGTRYVSANVGGGGGSIDSLRSEIGFSPAVPGAAKLLTIVITRLTDFPAVPFDVQGRPGGRTIEGPWRFDVPL